MIPIHDPPQPIAAEPAIPPLAAEKKYRLPAGQKVPPAQLRQRTAERNKPEVRGPEEQGAEPAAVPPYRLYESVVKECETCQKTKPAPPRSRFSGVRAKEFGDVVFMDHCEIKHMAKKHQLFLVLDGATSLLWGSTQQEGTEPVTQDLFREWMHIHSCKPRWVVADMAFFTPSWMTFCKTHGVKTMPTLGRPKWGRNKRGHEKNAILAQN